MRSLSGLAFTFTIALMLLPLRNSYAQADGRFNSLEEGAWALLFQVNGLPNVTFFDGVIALKHHLSSKQAIRFGVGGNGGTSQDAAYVQVGASAQGQYLVYPQPDREVNLYIGAGPTVGFNYNRREQPSGMDTRRRAWELGLTGRLGVEWFATRSISFLGEYGNEFSIRFEKRTEPDFIDDDARDYLYRTSAKLGIAAYF